MKHLASRSHLIANALAMVLGCVFATASHADSLIVVGNHFLLPNTAGQAITIDVTGGDDIQGVGVNAQIADGGPFAGGFIIGPGFVADIVNDTIMAANNTGQSDNDAGLFGSQLEWVQTTTAVGTVRANGHLVHLLFDTTGFTETSAGDLGPGKWSLSLLNTLNGATYFDGFGGVQLTIIDGSITIRENMAAPFEVPPPGLNPGDQYRLVFTTSIEQTALSPFVADYNAFVTDVAESVAELAALNTTWRAVISGTDAAGNPVNAVENTGVPFDNQVPIFRLDGEMVSQQVTLPDQTTIEQFWPNEDGDVSHKVPLDLDERRNPLPAGAFAWTRAGTGGLVQLPNVGSPLATDREFIVNGSHDPSLLHHFYVVSGILTVPVPEPASFALLAMGSFALLAFARLTRK